MRPLFYDPVISVAAVLRIHVALNLLYLATGNTRLMLGWSAISYYQFSSESMKCLKVV